MTFRVLLTTQARDVLARLAADSPATHRQVLKTLGLMETNLRSPSLQTHEYQSLKGPNNQKVFEAYVGTVAAAYRVFWYYGPEKGQITAFAITSHP